MVWVRVSLLSVVAGLVGSCWPPGDGVLRGEILDYDTLEPVVGAAVESRETGWHLDRGTWDHTYIASVPSAEGGTFALELANPVPPVLFGESSVTVWVTHPDYQPLTGLYVQRNTFQRLKVKRRRPSIPGVRHGFMRFGYEDGQPFGWRFADEKPVFDRADADIFPEFPEGPAFRRPFRLVAGEGGGLRLVRRSDIGVRGRLLDYVDVAPEDGYVASYRVDLEAEGGVYTVRIAGGGFAKLELDRDSGFGSEHNRDPEGWALVVEYVYRPDGGKELYFGR